MTCPPCSTKIRSPGSQSHSRHTYVSIRVPRSRILCFEEETATKDALSKISTYSINPENSAPIIFLSTEAFAAREGDTTEKILILAVHQDGMISCYDQHLQSHLWSEPLDKVANGLGASKASQTHYVSSLSMDQAHKSLLAQSGDIRTSGSLASDDLGSSLLFTISTTSPLQERSKTPSINVKLCSILACADTGDLPHSQSYIKDLLSYRLPVPHSLQGKESRFFLHASSGTLYQETPDSIGIFHLNDTSARLTHVLPCSNGQLHSSLRLSSNLILTLKGATLSLLDLPYCSLRAATDLSTVRAKPYSTPAKSRRQDRSIHQTPQLLMYSVKHKVALVYFNSNILAIPVLEEAVQQTSRKRKRPGLLLDSLGHGITIQGLQRTDRGRNVQSGHVKHDLGLAVSEGKLQDLIRKGNLSAFDDRIMSEIESMGRRQFLANPHRVSFILSYIFDPQVSTKTSDDGRAAFTNLTMTFWPSRTVGFLLGEALFTLDRVESALRRFGRLSLTTKLDPVALIDAVMKWDGSLALLHTILESSSPLSPLELARALVASSQTNQYSAPQEARLLTNTEDPGSKHGDTEMALVTTDAAAHNLTSSTESPDTRIRKQSIMDLALQRCYTVPSNSLTKAFKRTSTKPQLRHLVDHLRITVAQHGWLTPYDFSFDDLSKETAGNNQLVIIAHLLNSILDALGPAGWMLGPRSSQTETTFADPADTLSYMQAEVSAALEGIEEAMYLKGVLGEMLLCGKEALKAPPPKRALTNDKANAGQRVVKPTIVQLEKEDPVLPLGLRLKPPIRMTRVGAGGEVIKRSARDIGRLKSRMVGKYSFERIVI